MNLVRRGQSRSCSRKFFVLGLLILSTTAAGVISPFVWARPGNPTRHSQRIAILVSALMNTKHLSEMQVNDVIPRRTLDKFLESLDSKKMFFYQSDIDEFFSERQWSDDFVKRGDVTLANRIFDRFIQRVAERIAFAQKLVDVQHDFTIDEEIVIDPEKMSYPTSEAQVNERWRKKVKLDLLLQIADKVEHEEAINKLHKRYRGILRSAEQTDSDELLELFLSALTMSFDPHSNYMAPSTLENFNIQMRLELNGIGASLESKYGDTIVRRIVPGGAADKDGRLKIDDIIVGVAQGVDGEFVDIVEMKINDVVQKIRGKPGTIVRLEVNPADKSGRVVYDITRARIELKDSEARSGIVERGPNGEILVDGVKVVTNEDQPTAAQEEPSAKIIHQGESIDGSEYKIGIVSLPSFYMDMEGRRSGNPNFKSTTRDVKRLLEDFNQQNVDLVVMDLRFNGGGSLPESVNTTGLFIDKGPVVQVKGPDGRVQPYPDDVPGMVWSGPVIVLVNKFSASASEIFAGAIQDYGRGIVIGDHATHGKGTVQQLFELGTKIMPLHQAPNYGALKMTIQQFYRPGGDSTQNRGVVSDIEIPYRTTHWEGIGESDLDYAMKFDRVQPLPHANYHGASAQVIQQLQQRSAERCESTEFFVKERKKIKRYLEQKERATVTLNKEAFLAERAEGNSDKDQEEIVDKMQDDDRPVFPFTPYNKEVLAIAFDYLELLGRNRVAVAH